MLTGFFVFFGICENRVIEKGEYALKTSEFTLTINHFFWQLAVFSLINEIYIADSLTYFQSKSAMFVY